MMGFVERIAESDGDRGRRPGAIREECPPEGETRKEDEHCDQGERGEQRKSASFTARRFFPNAGERYGIGRFTGCSLWLREKLRLTHRARRLGV